MSLNGASLLAVSWRQYSYKLKTHANLIYGLLFAQLVGLLFSTGGAGSSGMNSGGVFVSIKQFSGNMVIIFSLMWILTVAILLTTKHYKQMDFTLLTNRLSSNLSNIAFLATTGVFAGVTSTLAGVFLRVLVYFTSEPSQIVMDGFSFPFADVLLGMAVNSLYLILFAALGYFMGTIVQVSILLAVIIPAALIGMIRINPYFFERLFLFLAAEGSPLMFGLKVVFLASMLFGFSIILSNRMEVRR